VKASNSFVLLILLLLLERTVQEEQMHWRSQVCLEGGLKVHTMIEVSRTGVPTGTHGRAGSIVIPHNAGLKIRKIFNCTITPKRRRRRRKGRGARGGGVWVFPSPLGRGLEKRLCPLPRKVFDFEAQNGEFWCILGTLIYSLAACFTRKKLVHLGLENLQQLHAVHCNQSINQ